MINLEEGSVECMLVVYVVGLYDVDVLVLGKGWVLFGFFFMYSLYLVSVVFNESGYGGGWIFVF